MLRRKLPYGFLLAAVLAMLAAPNANAQNTSGLAVNDSGYFETRGLNIFAFSNHYGLFGDEKSSGLEIIHHGVRTATNGDLRLSPTPEQWDSTPVFIRREINPKDNSITAYLHYPAYNLNYAVRVTAHENGVRITVILDKPIPSSLEGHAGFNLEFLPSAYFGKTYFADHTAATFPLYPSSPMINDAGTVDPLPLAAGRKMVLAPEDPERRITISSQQTDLLLFDGRNKAQNGWYVIRSLIPPGKTGVVIEWQLDANTIPNWVRPPVIAHSQLGYHPDQEKIAVIELDRNDKPFPSARLLRINEDGSEKAVINDAAHEWGNFLRYHYLSFDFTKEKEEGLYRIAYGQSFSQPFRIAKNIYSNAWHPTLDVYFPVQMDHIYVKEAYRVWHGASHMDDALQAPVNHVHFDLYAQGPSTDSPFQPLEHIPGLNIGGWYDAGDYDIRTQTQYGVVLNLVQTWENFKPLRDETSIDEQTRHVVLHHPDGKPDILQQVRHGVLQLLAQQKSVGHAINGIVEAHLWQYTHLGDAASKTDNLIYTSSLKENQTDGFSSGNFDDRWAFTSKSSALNYGSIAALAAASRVLNGFDDSLAIDCLLTAKRVWLEEQSHPPDIFIHGNTTGGPLQDEKLKAAVELLICTKDTMYASVIRSMLPFIERQFNRVASIAALAIPYMDASYKQSLEKWVKNYGQELSKYDRQNPFGVPVTRGGWAGSGQVIGFAITNYILYKAFPDLINREYVFRGLNYIYGCHPGSSISFVSAVGTVSKRVAYGNNRADYTFIAGGVVPGVLILPPDFPENKDDWPFLWGENEYVISEGALYIFLANAVNDLLNSKN